jgi:hypothetical protein
MVPVRNDIALVTPHDDADALPPAPVVAISSMLGGARGVRVTD